MRWSTVLKFFLGVLLAIAILAAGGLVAARVMIARLSVPPSKPMFPNDTPTTKPPAAKPAATAKPTAAKPETSATPLPTGAFPAKVTQSIGLVIRDAPSLDAVSIGGVDFNQQVTVIEASADGSWQKIRLANNTEGWVRAGNVEKVSN
ncbi:SH3 domain-containing protein [Leptolyngbya boryana CZ1]|uniref:SH3 domain-containing protein n=1 Tax=Leptolyngbya boryana CZ1 TaxID=3060204 RepID=A0AA96WX44_LEPBY|nr:SH3 domain-containing protein [Leptolyngbya boryana]WNZ45824.1 SH3 domain-containing protein [Leptolyngbya boryana CZ1]